MPRYTTSQTYTDGNTQIVALPERDSSSNTQIVEFKGGLVPANRKDDEDLEEKLRRISDHVPVRISNTSGSSAGSGSGDFHQYRQMRRREQDRLARMELDYQKRTEESEFLARREERMRSAEERTAKKRAKRLKKKEKKRQKKQEKAGLSGEADQSDHSSDEDDFDDDKRKGRPPLPPRVAVDHNAVIGPGVAVDHSVVISPHIFVRKSIQ